MSWHVETTDGTRALSSLFTSSGTEAMSEFIRQCNDHPGQTVIISAFARSRMVRKADGELLENTYQKFYFIENRNDVLKALAFNTIGNIEPFMVEKGLPETGIGSLLTTEQAEQHAGVKIGE